MANHQTSSVSGVPPSRILPEVSVFCASREFRAFYVAPPTQASRTIELRQSFRRRPKGACVKDRGPPLPLPIPPKDVSLFRVGEISDRLPPARHKRMMSRHPVPQLYTHFRGRVRPKPCESGSRLSAKAFFVDAGPGSQPLARNARGRIPVTPGQ